MSLSIYHRKCRCNVYLMMNHYLKFLCTFGIGNKNIKPSLGSVENIKTGTNDALYHCPQCSSDIKNTDELDAVCGYCGSIFPVSNLFKQLTESGKATGDIICDKCLLRYGNKEAGKISLATILKKVYIS